MTALELTEPVAITERGVYDIPEETYHRDPVPGGSLSCSGAKLLLPPSCPAKYAYARTQPPPATDAMEFGSAAHHEVLGTGWPYVVCDFAENYRTKEAQEWAAETRAAGKIPLLPKDKAKIDAMAAVIRAHPTARLLLHAEQVWREQSFFWQDEDTGVWLRARLDAAKVHDQIICSDFKSAASADPGEFARAAHRYFYDMQDAWYRDAILYTLGVPDAAFVFVVQEKDPPYLCAVYELSMRDVLEGRERNRRARRVFARCQQSGVWPGYQAPDEVVTKISLPRWAR